LKNSEGFFSLFKYKIKFPGFNQCATARIFAKLMTKRLGHRRYIAQGGDWGAVVVSCLAQLAPNNLHGIHLNMLPVAYERSTTMFRAVLGHFFPRLAFSQPESANYSLTKLFWTIVKEAGYMHIQATKPDTVGMGPHFK
jgi:pimeloyl-ACP methyl ester carboxylesterase